MCLVRGLTSHDPVYERELRYGETTVVREFLLEIACISIMRHDNALCHAVAHLSFETRGLAAGLTSLAAAGERLSSNQVRVLSFNYFTLLGCNIHPGTKSRFGCLAVIMKLICFHDLMQ